MTTRQIERLLMRMIDEIPAEMTRVGYTRKTCILHTRYAVDLLRQLGLRARPMAARVMVGNASWAEIGQRLQRPPQPHEWTDETWCLGIGYGPDPREARPGYDAHVFVIVNERWGLDLTLDQASRPERNMVVGPHFWQLSPGFLTGERPEVFRTEDGSLVIYQAIPEDRGFLLAPDWQLPSRVPDGMASRLARAVKAEAIRS